MHKWLNDIEENGVGYWSMLYFYEILLITVTKPVYKRRFRERNRSAI